MGKGSYLLGSSPVGGFLSKTQSIVSVMVTFSISSLSSTIVFPLFAPIFLNPQSSIFIREIPEGIRMILFGVFLASFPFAQFLFSPIVGEYADRRGRKPAFIFTVILEAIGYFLAALGLATTHLTLLFIGRVLTGLGAGNMSVCLASVVDLSSSEKAKIRYFSLGSALTGIMFVLGPFLGGILSNASISPIFTLAFPLWVGGGLVLVNLGILLFFFQETLSSHLHAPFDWLRAWHNIQFAFRTREIKGLYVVYFFFLFAWNLLFQFLPALLVKDFSANTTMIGNISAFMGVVWFVGTLGMLFLLHRHLSMKPILLSCFLLFSLFSFFISLFSGFIPFILMISGAVVLAGGMWPLFTAAISKAADPSIQGKILGISQSIVSLAMLLAPLIGGFLLQANSDVPFFMASVSSLIAALFLTKASKELFQL